jgi:glutathionyl-hydroquinone reductase
MEVKRQMDVLDKHLGEQGKGNNNNMFMVGEELSIADIALFPWVHGLVANVYEGANEFLEKESYENLMRWHNHLASRKAFKRGLRVNSFGDTAVKERHNKSDFAPEDYFLKRTNLTYILSAKYTFSIQIHDSSPMSHLLGAIAWIWSS